MVDEHAPSLQDWSARVEDPALQFELRTVLTAALDTLRGWCCASGSGSTSRIGRCRSRGSPKG